MKKNIVSLLVLFYSFILLPNFAFPQNSVDSTEKFIALSKNNMAINFLLGSLLFIYNDYDYNFQLTAKYHISDRLALRVSGGTYLDYNSENYEDNSNKEQENFKIIFSINMQYYLSTKTKVKPYLVAGLYTDYSNYYYTYSAGGSYHEEKSWGIGPLLTFGVEMFVLDNISLNGEYEMKFIYSKYNNNSNDNFLSSNYTNGTNIRFDFKTVRVGTSVYF